MDRKENILEKERPTSNIAHGKEAQERVLIEKRERRRKLIGIDHSLEQFSSNFKVHKNSLEILLKCRF